MLILLTVLSLRHAHNEVLVEVETASEQHVQLSTIASLNCDWKAWTKMLIG